jgi:hypothetical protein
VTENRTGQHIYGEANDAADELVNFGFFKHPSGMI